MLFLKEKEYLLKIHTWSGVMKALKSFGGKYPEQNQFWSNEGRVGHYALTKISIDNSYECHYQSLNIMRLTWSFETTARSQEKSGYYEYIRSICLRRFALSGREIDCYLLLAQGYRSKEIARELGISYRTVEKHIENIKEKLQCNTLVSIISMISQYLYEEIS